ncbi:hypothetical protein M422DRAFT_260876 [Sphaerobolus stellatus SS14]|uniref:DUF6818 domain-containing protein n=1 Tax=Sphaerobolus stellatus (strain SS14) TaxID=990650 RepID=A0A0C9U1V2_SPHS4|nr:hypothetical protein M422DRAFT_260876 [Sphaerobolus stellatus SS14]
MVERGDRAAAGYCPGGAAHHRNQLGRGYLEFNEAAAFENTSALEGWLKKLHSTPPPTGDVEVPPEVQRALEINEAINAKAGVTIILDNDDYDVQDVSNDCDDNYINEDEDENPHPAKIVKPNTPNMSSKLNMKGKGHTDGE